MNERVLLVEDKVSNAANGYKAIVDTGYDADLAFDLKSARFLMERNNYAGIVSDVCFQEEGVNSTNAVSENNKSNLSIDSSDNNFTPFMELVCAEREMPGLLEALFKQYKEIVMSDYRPTALGLEQASRWYRGPDTNRQIEIDYYRLCLGIDDLMHEENLRKAGTMEALYTDYRQKYDTEVKIIGEMAFREAVSSRLSGTTARDLLKIQERLMNLQINTEIDIPIEVQKGFIDAVRKSTAIIPERKEELRWGGGTRPSPRIANKDINIYDIALEVRGQTSQILRDEVTKVARQTYTNGTYEICDRAGLTDSSSYQREFQLIAQHNSVNTGLVNHASNPALGHFIFQEAKRKGVPTVAVTSSSHAAHAVPTLIADGVVDVEELKNLVDGGTNGDYRTASRAVFTSRGGKSREAYTAAMELLRKSDKA